jgi:glycosyltransferase involved in cell wall biosynthesis
MVHIALLMMLKNEEKRLHISLDSVKGYVSSLIIYDTGSTDRTIEILERYAAELGIPLRLKRGEFEDFSTSRNVSLDFADTFEDVDFYLMMDCNDELRNGEALVRFAEKTENHNHLFLLRQEWLANGNTTSYFNVRFIAARRPFRYKGVVHEYICGGENIRSHVPDVSLFQNRDQDDGKSANRFPRDKVMLLKEYERDPNDARTVFYLAQTYSCLNENEDAYYYYKIRSEMPGFEEERFSSLMKCGLLAGHLHHPWHVRMGWYMRAYEHSLRAEPVVEIANYYKNIGKMDIAFQFARMACELEYPKDAILFVDKHVYEYMRWHVMGVVAYYAKRMKEGHDACIKAIEARDTDLDKSNLKFYVDALKPKEPPKKQTRKEFVKMRQMELREENPNLSMKKMKSIINSEWLTKLK